MKPKNAKKPLYLMAGGNWRNPKAMVPLLKGILADTGVVRPRVAYVGAANGDDLWFYHALAALMKSAGAQVDRVRLASVKADVPKAKALLQAAEVVFISGGDVEEGMRWLKQHRLLEFFKKLHAGGKLFFGISAGSIMLGTQWVRWEDPKDDATAELFDCMGLAPLLCDTHAEKEDWEELKMAVSLLGRGGQGFGIPTGGVIRVSPSGTLTALEQPSVGYVHRNGQAVPGKNLIP
jgi:peptidase E